MYTAYDQLCGHLDVHGCTLGVVVTITLMQALTKYHPRVRHKHFALRL
jgi:hypothetical protein